MGVGVGKGVNVGDMGIVSSTMATQMQRDASGRTTHLYCSLCDA